MKIKNFLLFFSILGLISCAPNAPVSGSGGNDGPDAPMVKLDHDALFALLDKADDYCKNNTEKLDKYTVSQSYKSKAIEPYENFGATFDNIVIHNSHHEVDVDLGNNILKANFEMLDSIDYKYSDGRQEDLPPDLKGSTSQVTQKGEFITILNGDKTDTYCDLEDERKIHFASSVYEYGEYEVHSDFHAFDIYNETIDYIGQIKEAIDTKDEMNPDGVAFNAYTQGDKCVIQLKGKGYGTADVEIYLEVINNKLGVLRQKLVNTVDIQMDVELEKIFTPKENISITVPSQEGYQLVEANNKFVM